jgi:hypothetical protein
MELINHPKFLGRETTIPVPWPAKRPLPQGVSGPALPLVGNFYFEAAGSYPKYTNGTVPCRALTPNWCLAPSSPL